MIVDVLLYRMYLCTYVQSVLVAKLKIFPLTSYCQTRCNRNQNYANQMNVIDPN